MGAAIIPAGLTLLSGGVSAYGRYREGQEAAEAAERNREMALLMARDAIERGQARAGQHRTQGRKVASAQRVLAGAAGTEGGRLEQSTMAMAEMDATQAINNAVREAWGLKTQAAHLQEQADKARRAGNIAAGATILTSAIGAGAQGYGPFHDWLRTSDRAVVEETIEEVWGPGFESLAKKRRK